MCGKTRDPVDKEKRTVVIKDGNAAGKHILIIDGAGQDMPRRKTTPADRCSNSPPSHQAPAEVFLCHHAAASLPGSSHRSNLLAAAQT